MRKFLQERFHQLISQEKRDTWYTQAPRPVKWLWDQLNPAPFALTAQFQQITPEDIYYCYRLLLKREPANEELQSWMETVTWRQYTLDTLTHDFLFSEEYLERQERLSQPHLVVMDEFKLYVRLNDFSTGAVIARARAYEPHVTAQLRRILQPGDVFIDIGANVGFISMLGAYLVGHEGGVYAFEPMPTNCDLIRLSIAENQFQNITLYPYAVAEQAQTIELLVEGAHTNARLAHANDAERKGAHKWPITAVVLDDLLAEVQRIDLIKMDIEGAEPRAWQGMKQLVQRHRPYILTEFFPDLIRLTSKIEPETFLQMLQEADYELFALTNADDLPSKQYNIAQVMATYEEMGWRLLDLFACPREKVNALPYALK